MNSAKHRLVILIPSTASLKRIAWAYGCSPKGSDEERRLREMLLAKCREAA